MIILKIRGGLGNQMFQYAAGRAVSDKLGLPLYLDLSFYQKRNKCTKRVFELDKFNTIYSKKIQTPILGKLLRFSSKLTHRRAVSFSDIKKFTKENYKFVYLDEYWQSERYFIRINEKIRKHFTPKKKTSKKNSKIIELIHKSNSISVHIRRGDYISDKKTNDYHGVCSLDYYVQAINYIKNKLGSIELFFFSDDIRWVKSNLEFSDKSYYIDHNIGINSYWDLILMSKCKHNIIANSTFSWWGAWLNGNKEKIIIAPESWYSNRKKNCKTDIIPEEWIKL